MNQPIQDQGKGFFKALFDFSFKTAITPTIIKIIFGVAIVAAVLGWLVSVVVAFAINTVLGIFDLVIIGPIIFLLYVIFARVYLEVVMALFTIADNTTRMAQASGVGPVAPTPFQGAPQPYQSGPPPAYQPPASWAPTQTADPSGAWTPPPSAGAPSWSPNPQAGPSGPPPAWPGTPTPPANPPQS
jgi:uncharacterized protein DUF4282